LELLPLVRDGPGELLVLHRLERIAGVGHALESDDLDGHRRRGLVYPLALVVEEGPHLAGEYAGDEGIADSERAALGDDSGDDAPSLVDARLDYLALGPARVVRGELEDLGLEENGVEKLRDTQLLEGGYLAEDGRASPFLGLEPELGKLCLHPVDVRLGQI